MSAEPLRIALVGAECTGKSTLGAALAGRLPGVALAECLREFCEARGRTPHAHEQREIVEAQIAREREAVAAARAAGLEWVIADSTPLVTAIYSLEYFGDASLIGAAVEHQRGYACTLLAEPDLPWVADGIQRDGPAVRERVHRALAGLLREHGIAHAPVSGLHAERLDRALGAVFAARSELRVSFEPRR